MKIKCEIILLDTLWISAMALFASFWFDIRFGFNIFSGGHWHYLAARQASGGLIMTSFYASLAGFGLAGLIGLYFINRPRRRKIVLAEASTDAVAPAGKLPQDLQPLALDANYSPLPGEPKLPKPPRIIGPMHSARAPAPAAASAAAPKPAVTEFADMDKTLADIFESAGYIVKKPLRVGGLRLNLFAIGYGETLHLGLADPHGGEIAATEGGESKWRSADGEFTSPVWRISQAAEKIRGLFLETLDDSIQITIKTFVVMNGANITNRELLEKVWEAMGVAVFDSPESLQEFAQSDKNQPAPEEEQEDFDAYSEYMDTIASYFNKTQ
jgi:hypothetical protein